MDANFVLNQKKEVHNNKAKSKFTTEDDARLKFFVSRLGVNKWFEVSVCMGNKSTRQCRERWKTYLSPEISHEDWTYEEDALLYAKYLELGRKWSLIAKEFPNRTDTAIKNRCMVLLRRIKKSERIQKNKVNKAKTETFTPIIFDSECSSAYSPDEDFVSIFDEQYF